MSGGEGSIPERRAADEPPVEVMVNQALDAEDLQAISADLRSLWSGALVGRVPAVRSEGISWLALAALPLSGFLTTLGTSLAKDAHEAVRDRVQRILRRGHQAGVPGALVLEDRATGTRVVLEEDLPMAAYRALHDVELAGLAEGSTLRFDVVDQTWGTTS